MKEYLTITKTEKNIIIGSKKGYITKDGKEIHINNKVYSK